MAEWQASQSGIKQMKDGRYIATDGSVLMATDMQF